MKTIRFRFNHWLPALFGAEAITLYPWIFFARDEAFSITQHVVQHEMVHVEQVRRMGWFTFYWRYVTDYVKLRARGLAHWEAYAHLSHEMEAYDRQKEPALLEAYYVEKARAATS